MTGWVNKVAGAAFGLAIVAATVFVFWSDDKPRHLAAGLVGDLIIVSIFALAAYGVGVSLKRLLVENSTGLDGTMISISLGLTSYALAIFFIGTFGLLYTASLLLIIFAGVALAVKELAPGLSSFKGWMAERETISLDPIDLVLLLTFVIAAGVAFAGVLAPEIFYDTLYYHDAFARLYLIRHKIEIFPYAVHSAMPSNVNLLYVPLLDFGNEMTVKLGHFAFYLGTCLWIYALARRYFGRRAGLAAALFYAGLPGTGIVAGWGAVDHGVAFFSIGSMALLSQWIFDKAGKGTLVSAAILLGAAVGSKYSALMVGAVMAVAVVAGALKHDGISKEALAAVAIFGAVSLMVASPWYLRNLVVLHNPLYPAFEAAGSAGRFAYDNLKHDSAALYSWTGTFTSLPGDIFDGKGVFGAGAEIRPMALLLLLGILWGLLKAGPARWASIGVLIFYLLWARSILIVRYLYPGLALAAVVAGGSVMGGGRRRYVDVVAALVVVIFVVAGTIRVIAFQESYYGGAFRYISSSTSRADYLKKHAPHSMVAEWVRKNIQAGGTKILFIGATRTYYYNRDYEPISAYDRHPLGAWIDEAGDAASLKKLLRGKGFTHLIVHASEIERLNKSYGHCKLNDGQKKIFDELLRSSTLLAKAGVVEVYSLE